MSTAFRAVVLCTISLILGGCATGAKVGNMIYEPSAEQQMKFDQAIKKNTYVENVQGGRETNPAWISEISNSSFEGALMISLKNAGLLKQGGRYKLNVVLEKVDKPLFGFNTTVTTHVRYTLIDSESKKAIYDKTIVTPYTATAQDALVGVTRLRLANEGAAKENIKALLSDFAELKISAGGVDM